MLNQAISCMFRSTPSKDDIPWQPPRKVRQNFHLFSADRRWFLRSWSRITAVFKRLSRHKILMQFRFVMMTWAIGPMPLGQEETHKFQGGSGVFPPKKAGPKVSGCTTDVWSVNRLLCRVFLFSPGGGQHAYPLHVHHWRDQLGGRIRALEEGVLNCGEFDVSCLE